jgi:outer membrane protein TolC
LIIKPADYPNSQSKGMAMIFYMRFLLFAGMVSAAVAAQDGLGYTVSPMDTLTLEECVTVALQNQPSIGASKGAVITAESEYTQVLSSRFPQIQLEAGAYYTNTALQSSNVIAPNPVIDPEGAKFVPTLRMTLKQPIYDFGRTDKSLTSKNQLIKASVLALESTEEDVVLNVHMAYYNYVLAQHIVEINGERVNQAKKHLERAKGFFEVGKLPESEVSKAELEVANAELELISARGKSRLAKVTLNSSMGITEISNEPSDYQLSSRTEYTPFTADLKASIDRALGSRKEVTAADLKVKAWRSALSAAKSQYYPIISASAGVGPYLVQDQVIVDKQKIKMGYNIGLNFAFPIFQGLTVRADIAEAQGGIRIATSQYNVARQRIIHEVQDRYFNVKYAEERYKASGKLVEQGGRNLALAEGRFETGVGSAIEITDANFSLANARIEQTTALYNYLIEVSRFQRTTGVLSKDRTETSGAGDE